MQSWRAVFAVTFLAAIIVFASPYPALAQGESPPDDPGLSPYWHLAVSRWESTILQYAQQRNLDPDLIASVIWKESLGRPTSRGPAGAVGLMGVMPFDWRPSVEELQNPWTNVAWGARALAHTIRDGKGDLYYSLAAYNGGWEQTHLRVTRRYAADVLNHYARAVAARYGLPADSRWTALFAVQGAPGPNTITVISPQRPPTRYTERPWGQADIPTVPAGVPPHATVITFVDERGAKCQGNMWLVAEDGSPLMPPAVQDTSSPSLAGYGRTRTETPAAALAAMAISTPIPTSTPIIIPSTTPAQPLTLTDTPTPRPALTAVVLAGGTDLRPGATTWWYPRRTLPAGTGLTLRGYDPTFPDWVYVCTLDGAATGWVQISDLEINRELSDLPRVTPIPTFTSTPHAPLTSTLAPTLTPTPHAPLTSTLAPTLTPTPHAPLTSTLAPTLTPTPHAPPPTPTPPAECEGGPLWLEAWNLSKDRTPDSWTVTIYVAGHGGDCVYTYAWDGEVKGGPTSGSVTFEVSSADGGAVIVGTASVTSAGETVRVVLLVRPTGDDD